MASLKIWLFGGLHVQLDDQPITLAYDKVRALLAYLLVESGRPHRRETLAGLLWPEQTEKEARHSLSQALLKLRQAIDPDNNLIAADRHTVGWHSTDKIELDTAAFQAHLHQCQTHRHAQPALCVSCMKRRQTSVLLFEGPFLAGLSVPDAPQFEQWLTQQREHYHRQVMDTLDTLTSYHEQRGELTKAIQYAQQQLTFEPWQEEAHYQMMRLLLFNGQRSGAIAQYLNCVQVLNEELGVEPSPQTMALFKLIQTADPHPPHNLPSAATLLVGREAEIAQLTSWLAARNSRLITIVGPGGMGKTRLALSVAEKQLGRPIAELSDAEKLPETTAFFTHGVFWVALSGLTSASALLPAIAEAIGLQLESGEESVRTRTPLKQLLDFLLEKRVLLVLDNFEDLLDPEDSDASTGLIRDVLKNTPHVHFLVTSRERLALPEEHLLALEGLSYPAEGEPEPAGFAAVALFLQTAGRLRPGVGTDSGQMEVVANICRLLLGTPLAIELAANAISYRSLSDIVQALRENLSLLASRNRHVPARHRSMEAAFNTSWQRLPDKIRQIYAKLSQFKKGFNLAAAENVARAEFESLSLLIDRSLLYFDPELNRFWIHELLRQFASEKLKQLTLDVQDGLTYRHADYFLTWVAKQNRALKGDSQLIAIKQLDDDFENVRMAWRWACLHQPERIFVAIHPLCLYLDRRGRHQDGIDLCRLAMEAIEQNGSSVSSLLEIKGRLLTWTGRFQTILYRWHEGRLSLEQSLKIEQSRQDQAFALLQYGRILWRTDKKQAQAVVQQCLEAAAEANDSWTAAQGHNLLGRMARALGEFAAAEHHLAKSLAVRQQIDDQSGLAHTLSHLSLLLMDLGELKEAYAYAEQSLAIFQEMKEDVNTANAFNSLGLIKSFSGKFEESQDDFARSSAIFNRLGLNFPFEISRGYLIFSSLFYRGPKIDDIQVNRIAFEKFERAKFQRGMAYFELGAVLIYLGLGERELAYRHGVQGEELFMQLGQKKEAGECSGLRAAAVRDDVFEEEVFRHLDKYGEFILETRTFFPSVITMSLMLLYYLQRHEVEKALALHAALMSVPFFADSAWFQELFGKPVMTVANSLPSDVILKSKKGDGQQDFWEATAKTIKAFSGKQT